MKTTRKHRLNPSKLLVLLLYGTYPYMVREPHTDPDIRKVQIKVPEFANLLRVRIAHIIEYLEWLENYGYLTLIDIDKRQATFFLHLPGAFHD